MDFPVVYICTFVFSRWAFEQNLEKSNCKCQTVATGKPRQTGRKGWSACHRLGLWTEPSSEKGTVVYKRVQLITQYRCQRMMLNK